MADATIGRKPARRNPIARNLAIATVNELIRIGRLPADRHAVMAPIPIRFSFLLCSHSIECETTPACGGKDMAIEVTVNEGRNPPGKKRFRCGEDAWASIWFDRAQNFIFVPPARRFIMREGFGADIAALDLVPSGYRVRSHRRGPN